jgi:hypothetical protein
VVPQLIDNLNGTYGRPGIRFAHADVLSHELPRADLAISKDVLQHWPNESILSFIKRLDSFRYAILTNDCKVICRSWRRLWLAEEIFEPNSDIPAGGYRPIRLREPPFNLEAKQLTVIKMYIAKFPDPQRRPEVEHKEVLLWTNPSYDDGRATGNWGRSGAFHVRTGRLIRLCSAGSQGKGHPTQLNVESRRVV